MREELYHPLLSHFPIALLTLAPFFFFFNATLGKKLSTQNKYALDMAFKFSLWAGLLLFLIVLYLGDIALDAVKHDACSLFAISDHEDQAYYALWCFLLALPDEFLKQKWGEKSKILTLFLLSLGLWFLFKTGHSGAELVYDYGTGVLNHQCPD